MSALPGTTGRRRIFLMRHGHVAYVDSAGHLIANSRDVPLTDRGRDQARAAGRALSEISFDLALSSGLPRARETAELVLSAQKTPPLLEADGDLVELQGGGTGRGMEKFDGMRFAAAIAFLFDSAATPGARMGETGEFFADALLRGTRAIESLLRRPNWTRALVVAHEGINRVILSWMAGAELAAVSCFEQDLACINILDFDLVPAEDGAGPAIQRKMIKSVNLTADNPLKRGMYLTSLEAIFT